MSFGPLILPDSDQVVSSELRGRFGKSPWFLVSLGCGVLSAMMYSSVSQKLEV